VQGERIAARVDVDGLVDAVDRTGGAVGSYLSLPEVDVLTLIALAEPGARRTVTVDRANGENHVPTLFAELGLTEDDSARRRGRRSWSTRRSCDSGGECSSPRKD
jgi:hypothetical protein